MDHAAVGLGTIGKVKNCNDALRQMRCLLEAA